MYRGAVTVAGGNTIHTFTSGGIFDCTGTSVTVVNALVVGGGGGGGAGAVGSQPSGPGNQFDPEGGPGVVSVY